MKHLVLLGLFLSLAMSAQAQDTYTPPPMFGVPAAPVTQGAPQAQAAPSTTQRVLDAPATKFAPRYSPSKPSVNNPAATAAPEAKYTGTNNPLLPPVVTKGDPALEKPTAPSKPKKVQATAVPKPIAKPVVAKPSATAPAAPKVDAPIQRPVAKPVAPDIAKPAVPGAQKKTSAMPASRVISEGVVKGPKTMPSVPTTDVAAVSTFEAPPEDQTMMERHQSQRKTNNAAAPVTDADENATPDETLADVPVVNKASFPFRPGLSTTEQPDVAGFAAALNRDPSARLMIEAYANPADDGENSDRRLALARAMFVRKALIDAGAKAHRLDIRALGRKTAESPPDRVDVTLYNGRKSAN